MDAKRGFVVVFNRRAGRGRSFEILRSVTSLLDDRIAPVVETSVDGTFPDRLRARVREIRGDTGHPPIAVAVGGDGTVSMALNALREPDDATVAIVPAGSGNDFGAMLGIDSVRAALDALERGTPRRVDYGIVNGRRFANCVGMGLDAEVGAIAFRLRSRGYPAAPSYYAAALIGLFLVKPVGVTVSTPSAQRRFDDGVMVTVGNGALYGGGFRGAPDARIDDGLLDAYAFSDLDGVVRRYRLMQRIKAGTHTGEPNVTAFRAPSLIVAFDRDVAMHVDGETTTVRTAEIAAVRHGLEVLAPPLTA